MNSISTPTALTASASAVSYEDIASFQHSFCTSPSYRLDTVLYRCRTGTISLVALQAVVRYRLLCI